MAQKHVLFPFYKMGIILGLTFQVHSTLQYLEPCLEHYKHL